MTNEKNAAPIKKFSSGGVTAAIWENNGNKDGKPYSFNTISMQRAYKDDKDVWHNTESLRTNDLPKAILVLTKAYEELALKKE